MVNAANDTNNGAQHQRHKIMWTCICMFAFPFSFSFALALSLSLISIIGLIWLIWRSLSLIIILVHSYSLIRFLSLHFACKWNYFNYFVCGEFIFSLHLRTIYIQCVYTRKKNQQSTLNVNVDACFLVVLLLFLAGNYLLVFLSIKRKTHKTLTHTLHTYESYVLRLLWPPLLLLLLLMLFAVYQKLLMMYIYLYALCNIKIFMYNRYDVWMVKTSRRTIWYDIVYTDSHTLSLSFSEWSLHVYQKWKREYGHEFWHFSVASANAFSVLILWTF